MYKVDGSWAILVLRFGCIIVNLDSPEKVLGCLKTEPITTRSKKNEGHLGNTLVSGGLNPCLAFENMLNGIEHCIAYYAEDDNRITVLYATQMHEMVQYL